MADYSGNIDICSLALTDSWLKRWEGDSGLPGGWREPSVWGSFKDFREGAPFIEAPGPFLGFLIDGHRWGFRRKMKNNGLVIISGSPHISWDTRYKRWQLKNGFAFSNAEALKWLKRNGWIDDNYKILRDFSE